MCDFGGVSRPVDCRVVTMLQECFCECYLVTLDNVCISFKLYNHNHSIVVWYHHGHNFETSLPRHYGMFSERGCLIRERVIALFGNLYKFVKAKFNIQWCCERTVLNLDVPRYVQIANRTSKISQSFACTTSLSSRKYRLQSRSRRNETWQCQHFHETISSTCVVKTSGS